jgi:hypothetical protein
MSVATEGGAEMSAWSSIAKALTSFFRGGGGKVAASGAAEAAQAGTKVILTWGNTIKVAVVGCFSYLFLTGGLSNVVSTTLGIPEEVAQVIIIVVFVLFLALVIRYLVNYARDKMNLKQEYIDTPIFTRRSGQDHDNLRTGQQYIEPYQGYDRRFYDGSDWRRYR